MRAPLLLLAFALAGCQNAPVTGRSRLLLVNESEVASMAAGEFAKMKKLPNDPRLPKVREIGLKIVAAARRDDRDGVLPPSSRWQFAIIDDKTPNAFAMPGGFIGFNAGMFAFAPTDDDIAVILGHEVSHVLSQHGAERVSQGILAAGVMVAADEATKKSSAATRTRWTMGLGLATQLGVLLPYSRAHESEADHLGLLMMARAGYRPEAAPAFWTRFSSAAGAKPPEFLSTHPADTTRVKQLQAWIPEAKAQAPRQP